MCRDSTMYQRRLVAQPEGPPGARVPVGAERLDRRRVRPEVGVVQALQREDRE